MDLSSITKASDIAQFFKPGRNTDLSKDVKYKQYAAELEKQRQALLQQQVQQPAPKPSLINQAVGKVEQFGQNLATTPGMNAANSSLDSGYAKALQALKDPNIPIERKKGVYNTLLQQGLIDPVQAAQNTKDTTIGNTPLGQGIMAIPRGLADLPAEAINRVRQNFGSIVTGERQGPGAAEIMRRQELAQKTLTQQQQEKAKNLLTQDSLQLLQMVNDKNTPKQITNFLNEAQKRKSEADKKMVGAALEASSLVLGGAGLAEAATAGGARAVAGSLAQTGVGGFAGGVGNELRTNPNASTSDLLAKGAIGGGLGVGLAGVSAGLGAGFRRLSNGKVLNEATGEIVDESRLLAAQSTQPEARQLVAGDVNDTRNLATTTTNARMTAGENPGTLSQEITPLTRAAQPAKEDIKRLAQIDSQIREAQLTGNITADEARALVNERRSLVSSIENPQAAQEVTRVAKSPPGFDVKAPVEQHVVSNPATTGLDVAAQITHNQSALANTIAQQYPHLAPSIQTFTHEVQNQAALTAAAKDMVASDFKGASEIFNSGSLAQVNPSAHVKLGKELVIQAAKTGDTGLLNKTLAEHQAALTSHAQAMRAAGDTNILSPDAMVAYASKKADLSGRTLTADLLAKIEKTTQEIAQMPDGPEKIRLTQQLKAMAENPSVWDKFKNFLASITGSARASLASTDLSGGGRQGAILFARFPGIGANAEAAGAKAAFSKKAFQQEVENIANLTDSQGVSLSQVFKRADLSLPVLHGGHEEMFQTPALVEGKLAKKLGVGHVIEGSDRAYAITLSKARALAMKEMVDAQGGVEAVMSKWNTAQFKAVGRVIDTISGAGRGGKAFEAAAPTLSKTLFSARLWKSRLDLLNPLYYGSIAKNPAALRLAIRANAQFAATVGLVLGAATAAGAKVETDLRSSDFGKIKVGNTRIDIMGGLQQNLVFAWRELKGESKSSSTGIVSDLNNPGPGGQNRLSVAGRTVENKLAPVLGEIIHQIQGTDIGGNKMDGGDRAKSLGGLFVPLSIQDQYTAIKDSGLKGSLLAATGIFGAGVSTYPSTTAAEWDKNDSKTITGFKNSVNKAVFDKANQEFNDKYATWQSQTTADNRFKSLPEDKKKQLLTTKKQELTREILKEYGYKYKPTKNKDSTSAIIDELKKLK